MGMDLYDKGEYFRLMNSGWGERLNLAEAFGWVASGTQVGYNHVHFR